MTKNTGPSFTDPDWRPDPPGCLPRSADDVAWDAHCERHHARERALEAERDQARKTSAFNKDNHLAAEAEIKRLKAAMEKIVSAWQEGWDCSADPGHREVGIAVGEAAGLLHKTTEKCCRCGEAAPLGTCATETPHCEPCCLDAQDKPKGPSGWKPRQSTEGGR